jgi:hypothetical protein
MKNEMMSVLRPSIAVVAAVLRPSAISFNGHKNLSINDENRQQELSGSFRTGCPKGTS